MHDMSRDLKSHSAREIDQQPATIDVDVIDEVSGGKLERTPSHSLPAVSLMTTAPTSKTNSQGNGAGRASSDAGGRGSVGGGGTGSDDGLARGGSVDKDRGGRGSGGSVGGGGGGTGSALRVTHGAFADASGFVDVDDMAMQVDRDPNHWHEPLKVKFDDIFGEPDPEVFSLDSVWTTSNKVYTLSKFWCYRIISIVLAVPLAACCGAYFACLVFFRVWCCIPCLKICDIKLQCVRRLNEVAVRSLLAPCYEAVGRMFYHVRVRVVRPAGDENAAAA